MEEIKHENNQFENYEEVGVTCYLNGDKPILTGTVKHRYSDFIVNEIDMDGNIATLPREVDVAQEIKELENSKENKEESKQIEDNKEEVKTEIGPKKIEVSEEGKQVAAELLGEDGDRLLEHIRRLNEGLCERTDELALSNFKI